MHGNIVHVVNGELLSHGGQLVIPAADECLWTTPKVNEPHVVHLSVRYIETQLQCDGWCQLESLKDRIK